jgi:hypothetical protein
MNNIKNINEYYKDNRPIISFDFDGVLHQSVIEGTTHPINYDKYDTWKPFEKVHDLIFELSKTHKIIVVTKRSEWMREYTQAFIDGYNLPVEELYCTDGKSKWELLEDLGAISHYDDDTEMISECKGKSVKLYYVNPITEEIILKN